MRRSSDRNLYRWEIAVGPENGRGKPNAIGLGRQDSGRLRTFLRDADYKSALEHFHKCCSGVLLIRRTAVFLFFGFHLRQGYGETGRFG